MPGYQLYPDVSQHVDSLNALVRRHYRLIGLILFGVILLSLLWLFRGILPPFIIGFILAWLLQPLLDKAQKRLPVGKGHPQLQRAGLILLMYLAVAAAIGLAIFYVATTLGKSVIALVVDLPRLIPLGVANIELRLASYLESLPPSTQAQISDFIAQAGARGGEALGDFISSGMVRIRASSNMILGFVALPVFLFYLLKDWHVLRHSFYQSLPRWALVHVRNVVAIVRHVIGRWLRAQLILGLAVGMLAYILLTVAGVRYAFPLAIFAAVAEFVPIAGPWLSGIVGLLIVLATAPSKFLWVAIGYIAIQIFENHILAPRVQGQQMMIHPALVIVLTILAASVLGLLGFLIVLPLTMTIVQVVKYARRSAAAGSATNSLSTCQCAGADGIRNP